jgi:hypothetical protein
MEETSIAQEGHGEQTSVRQPYHAPKLISLGEIQSIVQATNGFGNDGGVGLSCMHS